MYSAITMSIIRQSYERVAGKSMAGTGSAFGKRERHQKQVRAGSGQRYRY